MERPWSPEHQPHRAEPPESPPDPSSGRFPSQARHGRTMTEPAFKLRRGAPAEVFLAFLKLGCLSFGGPIAHLGYFRTEFVERRGWLTDESFAEIVALA